MKRGDKIMKTKEEKIEYILENFDFEKVQKVMEFLNWKWFFIEHENKIPNNYRLIKRAKELLEESYDASLRRKEDWGHPTGGFFAESFYDKDSGEIDLKLSFNVDTWDTFDMEG